VSRKTASQYELVEKLLKIGLTNFCLNELLFNLFAGTRQGVEEKKEVPLTESI
jgi:hypothetical protein